MQQRLLFFYSGNRQFEIIEKNFNMVAQSSIHIIDAKSFIVNFFNGEHNTANHIKLPHRQIWMNGIYVHKDKGVAACIRKDVFRDILSGEELPEEIPKKFTNGAFCGIIMQDDRYYVFNDFMGLQPVYYYHTKGEIIISSSLKVLLNVVETSVNDSAINEFMLTGSLFSNDTIANEITCLGPASIIVIGKNRQLKTMNYASFSERTEIRRPQEEIIENITAQFKKAISRLFDSSINYSMSMTGGIDSRLIYLEWPNKLKLLTETAGEGSSDFIKAKQIIETLGAPELHELENHNQDKYSEGIDRYYQNCDDPLKVMGEFNSYHLDWKMSRGSFLHLSGVGGELLDGENLYLSRNKLNVLKESFSAYQYHELHDYDKSRLIANIIGYGNKTQNIRFLADRQKEDFDFERIIRPLDSFIGKTKFQECYTERFRTYRLANAGYYSAGSQNFSSYITILPYNEQELIKAVCQYHPSSRELRKLTIEMLRRYDLLKDIPIDTTHLKIDAPYYMHRFFRVLRMVMNIGYHKKIPILQKGEPPKFRAFPYFDSKYTDFRELVNNRLLGCDWFDKATIKDYISQISKVQGYNFYLHHGAETNIKIMLRMTYMQDMLRKKAD